MMTGGTPMTQETTIWTLNDMMTWMTWMTWIPHLRLLQQLLHPLEILLEPQTEQSLRHDTS